MRILIDADGCPVVDETLKIAKQFAPECLILCDTSHRFEREGAQTRVFSKGADSVDFALVNLLRPGDVVVTQDYVPGPERSGAEPRRHGVHGGQHRRPPAGAAHRQENPQCRRQAERPRQAHSGAGQSLFRGAHGAGTKTAKSGVFNKKDYLTFRPTRVYIPLRGFPDNKNVMAG